MLEPIDRQAALAEIDDTIAGSLQRSEDVYIDKGLMMARTLIEKLPTIEPEVRHGQWSEMFCYKEHGIEMADYECTNCGGEITKQRGDTPKYCEHCGADMREGAENDA